MKSMGFLIGRTAFYLYLAMFMLILGCSKKEEEEKPVDGDNPPAPITSITETIGSNGGTVALDSFAVTIPAGAFSNDHTLTLTVDQDPDYYQQPAVTSVFKLKGMPDDFSKPIRLLLTYHGTLEGDSYIAWGSDQVLSYMDTTFFCQDLIDCKDSSGYLTGYLLPPGQDNLRSERTAKAEHKNDLQEIIDIFQGVSSYQTRETNHSAFDLKYPSTLDPSLVDQIASNLEELHEIFTQLGFNQNNFPDFQYVNKVEIFDMRRDNENGRTCSFMFKEEYYYYLDIFSSPNIEELRSGIGSGFFWEFIINYIHIKKRQKWKELQNFAQSLNLWLAEKWNGDDFLTSYFSEASSKIYMDIFSEKAVNCEVIQYLSTKYGEEFIIRYYKTLINGSGWFAALSHVINDPVQVWLPDFFRQFFQGKIYPVTGQIFSEKVFSNPEVSHHIDLPPPNQTVSDTGKCVDLSARVFYFNMGSQYINENSLLECSLTSPDIDAKDLRGLLFSLNRNSKEITFITEMASYLSIKDPIKYKHNNEDLFMVVVNSRGLYTGEDRISRASDLQLDMTLKETFQLNYHRMEIVLDSIDLTQKYNNGQTFSVIGYKYSFSIPNGDMYDGSFSDNSIFTSDWDFINEAGRQYWGEAKATVDPDSLLLRDFDFKVNTKYIDIFRANEEVEIRQRITGINVPLEIWSSGYLRGRIKGENLVNNINLMDYIEQFVDPAADQKLGWYIDDIEFTENSVLIITFH
jgi:hypothetical protein